MAWFYAAEWPTFAPPLTRVPPALFNLGLGYLFGQGIEAAFGRVRDVGHVLLPVLAVLLLVGLAAHFRHRRREVTAKD